MTKSIAIFALAAGLAAAALAQAQTLYGVPSHQEMMNLAPRAQVMEQLRRNEQQRLDQQRQQPVPQMQRPGMPYTPYLR